MYMCSHSPCKEMYQVYYGYISYVIKFVLSFVYSEVIVYLVCTYAS